MNHTRSRQPEYFENSTSDRCKRTRWFRKAHMLIHFGDGLGAATFEAVRKPDYKKQIQNLIRRTGASMVQYHAKSQTGYTQYPTKYGFTNPMLKGIDVIRIWREATQELGVKFFAYYNLAGSDAEAEAHPDWTQRKSNGERFSPTSFGLREYDMCFNSPYLEELVLPKVRELIENYHVDGFWFDAGIWSKKLCYCKNCTRLFKEKYGVEPPLDSSQPMWEEWKNFHRESWKKFSEKLGNFIHSLDSNVIYCVNLEYSFLQPEPPADYVDVLSWDIGGGRRSIIISFASRFFDSQGVPFEIMICDHHRDYINKPTLPISLEYLKQKFAVACANGAVPRAWTSTMSNAEISQYYTELIGAVSDFLKERSEVFQDTQPFHEVAILHSATTAYKESNGVWAGNLDKIRGAHVALIQGYYHCHIVCEEFLARDINTYNLVIVSNQTRLPRYLLEEVRRYVNEGGNLLVTGLSATSQDSQGHLKMEFSDVLGVEMTGHEPLAGYVWQGFPLYTQFPWYPVETIEASTIAKWFHEQNGKVSSFPAITVNKFGKGKAAYIASDIFAEYYKRQHPTTLHFILKAVKQAYPNPIIKSNAPKSVEFAIRRKDENLIIHLVNLSVDWDTSHPGAIYTEKVPPLYSIKIGVKCRRKPSNVKIFPEDQTLKWFWKNGRAWMNIPRLHIHTALILENALAHASQSLEIGDSSK